MKRLTVFALIIFLATFVIGCSNIHAKERKASDFKMQDINGKSITLSDYSGKIIILNFFGTWCPPCRMEMPGFNEIAKEYKNDVEIIAIAIGKQSVAKVQDFVSENKLEFTVIMDDGKVSKLYGPIPGIPVSVIINRDFRVTKRYIGYRPKDVFIKDIKELL